MAVPLAAGIVVHLVAGEPFLPTAAALGAGVPLIAAGFIIWAWAIRTFLRHGEHPEPRAVTRQVIETGPYRYSRNPMYLAFALSATGLGFVMNSIPVLISVPFSVAAVQALIIRPEEKYLSRKFGETYQSYRRRVRRWL